MAKVQSQTARILIGVGLIVLGVLYFLKEVNIIGDQLNHVIFSFPTVVLVIGIILFVNSRRKSLAYLLMALGSVGMVIRSFNLDYSDFIVPVILLALGFYIIYRHVEKQRETELGGDSDEMRRQYKSEYDVLEEVSVFGGNKKIINSKNFRGGNITIIFGGSEIFLRDCELSDGENVLDLFVIFGGCDLTVPSNWNVKIDVVSLFGGFSSKRYNYTKSDEVDENKTLVIKGLVLFGGGEMKVF
jgi:predicted membrane protein